MAEPAYGPLRGHVTCQVVPVQRLWAVRHGGQRLGMDGGLLPALASGGDEPRLLRPERPAPQSACRDAGRLVQRRPAWGAVPAHGDQGRLAPVRAELLPALSARGTASPDR